MSPLVGVDFKKRDLSSGWCSTMARANIIVKYKTGILYLAGSRVLRSRNSFNLSNRGRKCQGCPLRLHALFFQNPPEGKIERAPISPSMGACWQAVRSLLRFCAAQRPSRDVLQSFLYN